MLSTGLRNAARKSSRVVNAGAVRNYTAPLKDMKFLINNVFDFPSKYTKQKNIGGENATPDMINTVLEETAKLATEVLAPLVVTGDKEGCKYVDKYTITTPPGFKDAYNMFVEGGWQGLSYPEKYGGQGLPPSMSLFQSDIVAAANWTWGMYPGLSKGAINTIMMHGTDALKEKYLHKMISGEWTGTMCLTEPQCGSDLAQVSTRAVKNPDGTYKISGTKIFISCGDHDFTDNIVHCVLARLPGAPAGTKGISLFAVPKKKINQDGSLGDFNGVSIDRIENKMGCHGSSTCQINFEDAIGELIGTENKGMNHMFTFINTSRLGTAVQGVAAAELSYQHSLPYAKERGSMRALSGTKNPDKPNDAIINHPSVRKLLMFQKAIAEGGRSMVYECCMVADAMREAEVAGDHKKAEACDDRLGFLTPILKGFLTEKGIEAANCGIQVWGGHGFIKENFQEQILRDNRIACLWEGTTQIQGLDLLGRKILLQKLKPINQHVKETNAKLWAVATSAGGETATRAFKLMLKNWKWQYNTVKLAQRAMSDRESVSTASVDYLMYSGYLTLAAHWINMEAAAKKALSNPKLMTEEKGFYEAKIHMSKYVFEELLPRTASLEETMFTDSKTMLNMPNDQFSFDYAR
jgi:alkylation response protein AidB-like acyl-CoA dehydrogenase